MQRRLLPTNSRGARMLMEAKNFICFKCKLKTKNEKEIDNHMNLEHIACLSKLNLNPAMDILLYINFPV